MNQYYPLSGIMDYRARTDCRYSGGIRQSNACLIDSCEMVTSSVSAFIPAGTSA